MKSWSQALIETMRQRPVKGDSGFGFVFAMLLLPCCLYFDGLLSGDERDQSLAERLLLNLSLQTPGVHDEAVHLDHPGRRTLLDAPAQHPAEVELANLEQVTDGLRLALAGAFGHAERLVDGGQLQVRGLAAVVEEVDPADDPHDGAGPHFRLAPDQRRGAFPGQRRCQPPTQRLVLGVQMLPQNASVRATMASQADRAT